MWYRMAQDEARDNIDGFERVAAAGLGRLLQHMMSGPFAILSAERSGMTRAQAKAAMRALKQALREKGFGFINTTGAWREANGIYGHERSVFVPMMQKEQAQAFGKQFGQEAVIHGERGAYRFLPTNPTAGEMPMGGDLTHNLHLPAAKEAPEFFTEVGHDGRKFMFSDLDLNPQQVLQRRQQMQQLGEGARVASKTDFYQFHAYAGNPPPMLPKQGVTRFRGDLPGVDALVAYLPFVVEGE